MSEQEERTVLVVSDDPRLREELRWGFPKHIRVDLVRDARQALASMSELTPSLAVVDIQTGSSGGFALARDMHAVRRLASVPILMLLERDQDAWLARQAGARVHRTKPVEMDRIVSDVLDLIG